MQRFDYVLGVDLNLREGNILHFFELPEFTEDIFSWLIYLNGILLTMDTLEVAKDYCVVTYQNGKLGIKLAQTVLKNELITIIKGL